MAALRWKRTGDYQVRAGKWCITKSMVGGEPRYVLTHDLRTCRTGCVETHQILGVFQTAQAAMDFAEKGGRDAHGYADLDS